MKAPFTAAASVVSALILSNCGTAAFTGPAWESNPGDASGATSIRAHEGSMVSGAGGGSCCKEVPDRY